MSSPIANSKLSAKAKLIRLVLTDVDGILTDGKLYYGPDGESLKGFHARDGLAIKMLQENNIPVGVLTGRKSSALDKRMQELNIEYIFDGLSNKLIPYEQLLQDLNLTDQQIAYLGDDTIDLPVLQRVGLSITVNDAPQDVKDSVDWCLTTSGGDGALREVKDLILQTQL